MSILNSDVLKSHVNRYSFLGLLISLGSIITATLIVAYQLTGRISLESITLAQTSNPAIWALDLTPLMFAYWGQSFCYGLVHKAETILRDKTRELTNKKDDLEIKLKYESTHDSLTNLPNYKLFVERIKQAIQQIEQEQQDSKAAVIVLSISDFKEINYSFGTFHANSFLKQFAEKLKNLLIEPFMLEAYMGMNVIARLRNDEFAMLLPRLSADQDMDLLLHKIQEYTSVNFMIEGINMNIMTTIGAALYPTHGMKAETLMMHATDSIYFAKKEGKPYAIYHKDIQERTTINREMLDEFEHIMDAEQAVIQLQPHYELASRTIVGVEGSVKLDLANWEILNEEKLFHLMNDTRYAKKVTFFSLKTLIKQLALWHKEGYSLYGEVDLSMMDIGDSDLVGTIKELLAEHQLDGKHLRLSLTEKACLSDQARALNTLTQLTQMGIEIAIKDFSTGYTSFVYLTNFPIKEIKIDRSFIMKMGQDEKKVRVVHTIIQMAAALNLNVMACGIPDEATVEKLITLGCRYGQGACFDSPASIEEITEKLDKK